MAGNGDVLSGLEFSDPISFGSVDWKDIPDAPGVYVISDGSGVLYVGMAGRDRAGSLRRRLRDHASGQIVNMFAQYLLFARLLFVPDPPRTPSAARERCRAYIRTHCSMQFRVTENAATARALEESLRSHLAPILNGTA